MYNFRGRPRHIAAMVLAFSALASVVNAQDTGGGYRIEKLDTTARFVADGTETHENAVQIRMQSDSAVRAFGVLAFPYSTEFERLEVDYVRVRKPDGRVVETPASTFQEAPSPVATAAPMYSDLRIKQIPVRSLADGDLLEYRVRWVGTKPLIANQFWFSQDFEKTAEVQAETLTLRVPAGQYVKLSSPEIAPQTHEENGEKVYSWTTSHAFTKADPDEKNKDKKGDKPLKPSVEMTTFHSWDEVGRWYADLAKDKVAVTPEVKAKADELTKGLTTVDAKERAIYDYVSTKFRYISISLGQGRYQPHSAAEVMINLYGDCKDKHTLLTALMKAAGIDVSTVLIGTDASLNPDMPSPASFDHVIGVIRGAGVSGAKDIWLDTTPEVAPFGWIEKPLRGHDALLIESSGVSRVVSTPDDAVTQFEVVQFKGTLDEEGTMSGHLDISLGGDAEIVLRSVFHANSATQWADLAQSMAEAMGYAGKVSAVDIDNPQDTSKRFHFGWDYRREKYGDWANLRIPAPVPLEGLPELPDDKSEPLEIGKNDNRYDAELKLPAGYSVEIPSPAHVSNAVGEYQETYKVTDGLLEWHRTLVTRMEKIGPADRDDYSKLMTEVNGSAGRMMALTKGGSGVTVDVSESNPRALELMQQAQTALQNRQNLQAADALKQAETLNPKEKGLWLLYAEYYALSGQVQQSVDSLKKETELHPSEPMSYKMLGAEEMVQRNRSEAKAAFRKYMQMVPADDQTAIQLAGLLEGDKEYDAALNVIDEALKFTPDSVPLGTTRVTALIGAGKKQEAVSAAKEIQQKIPDDASALNDIGYELLDSGADLVLGRQFCEKSVAILEDKMKDLRLTNLNKEQLAQISTLGAAWDSVGWANFLNGDAQKALGPVEASWRLVMFSGVADHLGQIYEKLGRKDDAVHMYRLAMAAGNAPKETAGRLKALEPPPVLEKKGNTTVVKIGTQGLPVEDLNRLRTVDIPGFTRVKGAAEFFILFNSKGPEDVSFISGADDLRAAKDAILHAKFDTPFADDGPEKIARRGVLSCSQYTKPNCQLVLLLPANTTVP